VGNVLGGQEHRVKMLIAAEEISSFLGLEGCDELFLAA